MPRRASLASGRVVQCVGESRYFDDASASLSARSALRRVPQIRLYTWNSRSGSMCPFRRACGDCPLLAHSCPSWDPRGTPASGRGRSVADRRSSHPGAKPPQARRRELRTLEPQLRPRWARQVKSSPEPLSIASRIWSACEVLGSSMRRAATNSSRLVLAPRTSSNEAKEASASATESLTAFASPLSTKEIIHWMQSSRAMMVRWSRSLASQSRRGPRTVHLGRRRQTRSGPVRLDELRRSLPIVRA